VHLVVVLLHAVDGHVAERDALVELALARPDDVLGVGEAERYEQQPRLVDVAVVLVDDLDRQLGLRIELAEAVGHERAARAAPQDHDALGHGVSMPPFPEPRQGTWSRSELPVRAPRPPPW
jgi:hypothetical protein